MDGNIYRAWFLSGILCVLIAAAVWGEENKNSQDVIVPVGMELIKKGDVNILVPKGQSLIKDSSFFVTQNPDEYASRKFMGVDERFERMDEDLDSIKEELKRLREAVDSIKQEKVVVDNTPSSVE